jgi:hypothetical protein
MPSRERRGRWAIRRGLGEEEKEGKVRTVQADCRLLLLLRRRLRLQLRRLLLGRVRE